MASRIRRGDTVQVITGKDKGKSGIVARVLPEKNRVVVRGVNMVKRHTRPTQKSPNGGIIDKEAPMNVSNVMIVDPEDNKPTRVKFTMVDNRKVRVGVRTGAEIPEVLEVPEQA